MKFQKFYRIHEICKLFDIGPDAIRYYEKLEIISPKRETQNNYRLYSLQDIQKIATVRELLNLNFSLKQVKDFEKQHTLKNTISLLKTEKKQVYEELKHLLSIKINIENKLQAFNRVLDTSLYDKITILTLSKRPCLMISNYDIPESIMDYTTVKYMQDNKQKIDTIGSCDCYTLDLTQSGNDPEYYRTKNIFFYAKDAAYHSNYELPEGMYLSTLFSGPYTKTRTSIEKMLEYARINNLKIISDPIEFCHIDEYETNTVQEYVTEIQIQIAR
jgi:DNA-binding transcriptional MerR regulator/effector-binding domain-containing protein